jgi:hypothetical protein
MKRLISIAAMFLATSALSAVFTARASGIEQRGSQGEARTLTGRVLNDLNAPMQKAIVYLKNTKTLAIKTYISETDGSYRFPGLAPNVDYEVYAEHEGSRSDTKTLSGFDSRKQASITLKIHGK